MIHVAAFLVALAIDFAYARMVLSLNQRRRTRAAFYSTLCSLLSQLVTLFCVHDPWLIVATCGGVFFGMWLGADDGTGPTQGLHRRSLQEDWEEVRKELGGP